MDLEDFISQAGDHGCCVGIYPETVSPLVVPHGVELRLANGSYAKTLGALYETIAEIWHFPPWFGRNKDAFTDFICDLDNMIDATFGRPPAPAYLTAINDAHLLLIEEPEASLGLPTRCACIGIIIATKQALLRRLVCYSPPLAIDSMRFAYAGDLRVFRLRR